MIHLRDKAAVWTGLVCAALGVALFQFWGNAARGYIDTRSLFYWWGYQWFDPASDTQHGPLIVLVSAWLFWRNLGRSKTLGGRVDAETNRSAVTLMLFAIGLHVLGYAMQQTRVSVAALLLFVWGTLTCIGGTRWRRASLFPLALLLLAIPISFLQPLGFYLRLWVSESAEALLHGLGMPVIRNGTQLFAPDGRYQYDVAAACSGVRSLVALFGLSLVIGYMRLPGWKSRVALACLTAPFAFAGNFLRIFAIILTGQWFGQAAGERVHDYSGFLTFAVVWGFLMVTTRALQRRVTPGGRTSASAAASQCDAHRIGADWVRNSASFSDAPADTEVRPARGKRWLSVGVMAIATLAAALAIQRIDERAPQREAGVRLADNGVDPAPLPEFIGTEWIGQRVDVSAAEKAVLPPDTGYSRRNYVWVQDLSRQVFFSVVLSGRDRTSIHRPELCVIGQGWNIVERRQCDLRLNQTGTLPATLLRIQRDFTGRDGQRVTRTWWLAYWFVGHDSIMPSHAGMMWRSSLDRLTHLRGDRWAYVLAQTEITGDDGEALSRIEEVVGAIWPAVHR